jgi:hypothetical protein
MGRALEVISGRATNPSALSAATPNSGDSFTVRDFPEGANAYIAQVWAQEGTLGVVRIRSARLHDAAQAIRLRVPASARPLLPYGATQRLQANDPLTVEIQGGGAETDVVAMLLYYDDLPGVDARLASPEDVLPRIRNLVGLEQNITTGATVGDYGGSQSITADFDILKADTDYCVLGYLTDVTLGVVGIRGSDVGNLRVGGPGITDPDITAEWFVELSRALGRPCIPILNSNNRGSTLFDVVHNAASAPANVTLILGELG